MCCLSEASSHFVVFVCVNPDRKPSRKMKRRNINRLSDYSITVYFANIRNNAVYLQCKNCKQCQKRYTTYYLFAVFVPVQITTKIPTNKPPNRVTTLPVTAQTTLRITFCLVADKFSRLVILSNIFITCFFRLANMLVSHCLNLYCYF